MNSTLGRSGWNLVFQPFPLLFCGILFYTFLLPEYLLWYSGNQKKEGPSTLPQAGPFPHVKPEDGTCLVACAPPSSYIIMNNRRFFKQIFSFRQKTASLYSREACSFQYRHNRLHPDCRIHRHMLCPRTFHFFHGGHHVLVQVCLVRFRFSGTNRTFTFYGSLFLPFSRFSLAFIRQAVSEERDRCLCGPASTCVSSGTVSRWARMLADAGEHTPAPGLLPVPCPIMDAAP